MTKFIVTVREHDQVAYYEIYAYSLNEAYIRASERLQSDHDAAIIIDNISKAESITKVKIKAII